MGTDPLQAITEAAEAMHVPSDAAAVIAEIVVQASRFLPEFEHVSLTRIGLGQGVLTLAATTELARKLDELQDSTGEGPCLDTMTGDETIVVKHAPHEQRWPEYNARAVNLGLRAQIAVRLQGQEKQLVGLNLYSTSHDEFDAGSVGVAEQFAIHAGLALGQVRREEQLNTAIGTRTIIGTAVGVLIERYGLSREQAFSYLTREASHENRKVRMVAADLVEAAEPNTSDE